MYTPIVKMIKRLSIIGFYYQQSKTANTIAVYNITDKTMNIEKKNHII